MYNLFITMLTDVNKEIEAQIALRKPSVLKLFLTTLALLGQEIDETSKLKLRPLSVFCGGCDKVVEFGRCSVYANPVKLIWFRQGQQCAMNYVPEAQLEKKVNALKASKRAALGR